MRKILLSIILIFSLIIPSYSMTNGRVYSITSYNSEIQNIIVNAYNIEDSSIVNGFYVMNQRVSLCYSNPYNYNGNLIFNCRLINSETQATIPIQIIKFIKTGYNKIDDFYMLPTNIFDSNSQTWIHFFNIIYVDSVISVGG